MLAGWRAWPSSLNCSVYAHAVRVADSSSTPVYSNWLRLLSRHPRQRHTFRSFAKYLNSGSDGYDQTSVLDKFKASLTFEQATHEIKDLAIPPQSGSEEVILHGYLGGRTDLSKNLFFVPLLSKDLSYSIQIVSNFKSSHQGTSSAHEKLKSVEPNSPVLIKGVCKARERSTSRDLGDVEKIKTTEIKLLDVQCLNEFPKDIIWTPETVFPPEDRHLQIRSDRGLRNVLNFRSQVAGICRDVILKGHGFVEVETPILFKSTPEGAREFVVPTRREGLAYALPQSPQQYKQILMGSGIPKYFQIAKCFRDEDLRADRQPEFTQLDLEMSFASGSDVMECIEDLIRRLWKDMLQVDIPAKFPRMTYHQAMTLYGSDKPDARIEMPIHRIGHLLPADLISKISPLINPIVETLILKTGAMHSDPDSTRRFVSAFMSSPEAATFNENPEGGPGVFIYDPRKPLQGLSPFGFEAVETVEEILEPEEGDLIILQAREDAPHSGGSTPLGNLRLALHKFAVHSGLLESPQDFQPLWITDFPLFSPISESEPGQGGAAGLASTHHPFTSPKSAEDVDLLLTEPSKVIGEHYDLVMNGVELGGGSRRIHNADMQHFVMEEVLKMTPDRIEEFSHLLKVLRAGCPPHAGIALGFDRLVALMLGKDSVRDVIAFPKNGKGEDLLIKSPSSMSEAVLKTYHLKTCKDG